MPQVKIGPSFFAKAKTDYANWKWAIAREFLQNSLDVNGEVIPGNLKKGSRRREFDWGTVYTNRVTDDLLVVRIGGIPMFTKAIDHKRCVVVELTGSSGDILTANRDGLQWHQSGQLDTFLHEVAVDCNSALQAPETRYIHYDGEQLAAHVESAADVREILTAAYAAVQEVIEDEAVETENVIAAEEIAQEHANLGEVTADVEWEESVPVPKSILKHQFLIKDEIGQVIPAHYLPETFSPYSRKLLKAWAACMLEIHSIFGDNDPFSVGFLFNEDVEAEHEENRRHGRLFYINPTSTKRNSFGGRSFANRWQFNAAGKAQIVMCAVHEFCHKQESWHNERYSTLLTDYSAVILRQYKRFHKCFR